MYSYYFNLSGRHRSRYEMNNKKGNGLGYSGVVGKPYTCSATFKEDILDMHQCYQ